MHPTTCVTCGNLALGAEHCYQCSRKLESARLEKAKEDAAIGIIQVLVPGAFPCRENIEYLVKHLERFVQAELATRPV